MTSIVIRYSAPLERLMDICSPPSFSKEKGRGQNIFGYRSSGDLTNLVEGAAPDNIAGAGAPRNPQGVFDRL